MESVLSFEEMEFYAYHGCFIEEKRVGGFFTVNLSMTLDVSKAAFSDRIEDTLDYTKIYAMVKEEMGISSNLIENVAQRILSRLRSKYPEISKATLKLSKRNPPIGEKMKSVSIELSF